VAGKYYKKNIREILWVGMEWVSLAQDTEMWKALVNMVIHLRVTKVFGNSRVAERLSASQEALGPMIC
jgi:hypothetical protein